MGSAPEDTGGGAGCAALEGVRVGGDTGRRTPDELRGAGRSAPAEPSDGSSDSDVPRGAATLPDELCAGRCAAEEAAWKSENADGLDSGFAGAFVASPVTTRFTGRRNVSLELDGLLAGDSAGLEASEGDSPLDSMTESRVGRLAGSVGGSLRLSFRPHDFAGFEPQSPIPPPPRFKVIFCSASTNSAAD